MNKHLLLIAAIAALACGAVAADPYLGFVTVPGDIVGDDMGPDPRILGEAWKFSGATCARAGLDEAQYYPLNGRAGIGYGWDQMSASDIQAYNSQGYMFFIFENEPDGTAQTNPDWAEDYMTRLNRTYPTFKAVSPYNQVIGGNLFSNQYDALYDHGFKNSSDMTGFHCYSNDPATGINIGAVNAVRNEMVSQGDSAKKIFLGEGWGPMRELPGLKRLFPDSPPSAQEIRMLRDFVVNGYWNIVTAKSGYDPGWVWGVLFFTLNDNWGGRDWASRAVPHYDQYGNLSHYTVDGYNVGLDIFPHFYNGGLVDVWGNAKDNVMDVFPGKGLALSNSGFEYYDPAAGEIAAYDWNPKTSPPPAVRYGLDASIRHGGQRSQRVTLSGSTSEYVRTDSVKSSVTPGLTYNASVWARTFELDKGASRGAALKLDFLTSSGTLIGGGVWSAGMDGTQDWTKLSVSATAPSGASKLRVTCAVEGASGRAWFDDACAWQGSASAKATLSGFVLDDQRNAVAGAAVATASGGYSGVTDAQGHFVISNVEQGVYDISATRAGYREQTASAQVALPGKTRALGYALAKSSQTLATGVRIEDPGVGSTLKLSWVNPTGAFDKIRIYRSSDPGQIGTVAHDNVQNGPIWDTGLQDGVRYSYTFRTVIGGVETTNSQRYYGVPSGGVSKTAYSYYPGADWGHWAGDYGQTFVANMTGYLASASCTPGFGGGGSTNLTFRVYQGGPSGDQVGTARTILAAGDAEGVATWNQGEVPLVEGQTYYLRVTGSSGFAAYRGGNVYAQGQFYINGAAQSGSDMWSTITIAKTSPVVVMDVTAVEQTPGTLTISWKTNAPAGSQVEIGQSEAYGSLTGLDATLKTEHAVQVNVGPEMLYHFRVRSARAGLPEAVSLDYTFSTSAAQAASSAPEAKSLADGSYVRFPGVVTLASDGFFYVQNGTGRPGIRVLKTEHALVPGEAVNLTGIVATNADGERCLEATHIDETGSAAVDPVVLANAGAGGGDWPGFAGGVAQEGVAGGRGLNNIGMLVQTCGRVTGSAPGVVYLDDGSALSDGSGTGGIRVLSTDPALPLPGDFIRATGVLSCYRAFDGLHPRIIATRPLESLLPD